MKHILLAVSSLLLAPLAALNAADTPQKPNIGFIAEQWAAFETSYESAKAAMPC